VEDDRREKEVSMNISIHVVRNAIAAAVALIGLVAAAAVVDGALATIVALVGLGLIVAILPFVVIHYDEHEERLRYRHPGQS
jgi:hypothetical protein